jgi:glycosyltransferase involved in cell wall biosynthesis
MGLAHGLSGLTDGDEEYRLLTYEDSDDWIRPYACGPVGILWAGPSRHVPTGWRNVAGRLPGLRPAWHRLSPLLGSRSVTIPDSDGTIEGAGVDLMHFTQQYAFRVAVPSIYHPHDLQHLHLPEYFTPRIRMEREILYRTFCERASMVAVTSRWIKEDVQQQYSLPAEKVRVVAWAPAVEAYERPSDSELRRVSERFSLPQCFVFYPAQTWPHKNHIGLLEAIALLRDQHGLIVNLVSSGRRNEFFPTIEKRIRGLGLESQVRFVGFVDTAELRVLYRLSTATVIPTKFEAASGPLWEAFLEGSPAGCSRVTSLPEQAGDAALLFDPDSPAEIADVVRRLWTDADLRATLVERGRQNVSRFSWDRTARAFRAHYRRVCGREVSTEDLEYIDAAAVF